MKIDVNRKGVTMKSFYELKEETMRTLEQEFRHTKGGKMAYRSWIINNIISLCIVLFASILFLTSILKTQDLNMLGLFALLLFIMGFFTIFTSTHEYQQKYNSWLEIKHHIKRVSI